MNAFSHLSLLIDLDCEKWWPSPDAFTDPANHFPKRSRRLLHETLHYWQQLSQGYLLLLAEEDWNNFMASAETGKPPPEGPRRRHFKQSEGHHGMSAWNIAESLTQFWEVFIVGSEAAPNQRWTSDAELDAAMLASRDYSEPFRLARRLLDPRFSLLVFPLFAHFALKTHRPAYFFERFLDEIGPKAGAKAEEIGVLAPDSDVAPGALYPFVETWCNDLVRAAGESGLLHAVELFPRSSLRANPAYAWSFERLARLAGRVRGNGDLDTAICLPGQSAHRRILAEEMPPPCLRFADGSPLALAWFHLSHAKDPIADAVNAAKEAAAACWAMQSRWDELRAAARGY